MLLGQHVSLPQLLPCLERAVLADMGQLNRHFRILTGERQAVSAN